MSLLSGMVLYINTEDTPHEPPTHAVPQEFEPYLGAALGDTEDGDE